MKRIWTVLLALCVLFSCLSAFAEEKTNSGTDLMTALLEYDGDPYLIAIFDEAGLLNESEMEDVLKTMRLVSKYANTGFISYPTLGDSSQKSVSKAMEWGEGIFGADSPFVVFIIDMKLRHLDIYCSKPLSDILTSAVLNTVAENVYRYATDGEYGDCVVKTFKLVEEYLCAEEFVFRGGIKWGMSLEEVAELEGDGDVGDGSSGFVTLSYGDIPISKYQGNLGYLFFSDQLVASVYALSSNSDEDVFEYLKTALQSVYGEGEESSFAELYEIAKPLISTSEEVSFAIWKWVTSDKTSIYLTGEYNNWLEIIYFSPEFSSATKEEINTTGL